MAKHPWNMPPWWGDGVKRGPCRKPEAPTTILHLTLLLYLVLPHLGLFGTSLYNSNCLPFSFWPQYCPFFYSSRFQSTLGLLTPVISRHLRRLAVINVLVLFGFNLSRNSGWPILMFLFLFFFIRIFGWDSPCVLVVSPVYHFGPSTSPLTYLRSPPLISEMGGKVMGLSIHALWNYALIYSFPK